MIPLYQRYLFAVLLVTSVAMSVVLWQLRERGHQRLIAGQDSAPTKAPEVAPAEQATLVVANDSDSSLLIQTHSLPLPADPGARARAVLGKLLDLYAAPNATHPVPGGGSSVTQVFLMPAPEIGASTSAAGKGRSSDSRVAVTVSGRSSANASRSPSQDAQEGSSQLAVVNLTGSFAASHPSGIQTELLTVLSICGTLHANLPRVTQVRFLVDGQPRATLAGHGDLTRTYLAADAVPAEGPHP